MTSDPKNNIIELHIDITDDHIAENLNILDIFAEHWDHSRQNLKDAMQKGALWLTQSHSAKTARPIRRKNAKLKAGNQLHLYYNPQVLSETVEKPTLITDEGDYSVWNKPYGVWSHGSKWGDHCSIGRLVEQHFNFARQSFVVHRLDRAANGLMIIAHNKKAAKALSDQFANRQVDKIYRARVNGHFTESQTINSSIDDKSAISHVSLINYDQSSNKSLVAVKIETGRKHQIRKHLASIGFPIIGDRLYGNAKESDENLQLSAYQLSFTCPISQQKKRYQLP